MDIDLFTLLRRLDPILQSVKDCLFVSKFLDSVLNPNYKCYQNHKKTIVSTAIISVITGCHDMSTFTIRIFIYRRSLDVKGKCCEGRDIAQTAWRRHLMTSRENELSL